MAFLFRWLRRPTVPLSIGAGLCLGLAPVIRPTSVLLWLVPVAVAIIVIHRTWRNRRAPDAPAPLRAWLPVAILPVAGAIFPAGWLAYNQIHFGSPFVTGYDLAGEQYAFLWSSWPGITRLLKGLLAHGPAVVAGIGLFAILLWPRRLERLLLLLWLLPLIVAYGVYYWSLSNGGAMVTRFLLCLFPLIVAAAFAGLEHVLRTPRSRLVVPIVLAALAIAIDAPGSARDMRQVVAAPDLHQQLTAFRAIRPHLRDGAVLIAGEPLIFHLGPGHNWQLYDHQVFEPRYVLNQTRHRRHSDPRQQPSRIQAITNYYTNHQTDLPALYREFVRKRLAAGDQVAIVLPTERLASEQSRLGKAFQITQLTEWSQPRTRWQRDDDGHWYESSYDETQALYGITLADR